MAEIEKGQSKAEVKNEKKHVTNPGRKKGENMGEKREKIQEQKVGKKKRKHSNQKQREIICRGVGMKEEGP